MRVVCAPDSFKESLTALEAATAMRQGVLDVFPDADCTLAPITDGGEGFCATLASALDARLFEITVPDALGRLRQATYAVAGTTAIIESAQAVGLEHITPDERAIVAASTTGVGTLMLDALDRGATTLIIGLGGSATNDGGAGMLASLGVSFTDTDGHPIASCPHSLANLAHIDASGLDPRVSRVTLLAACDVTAPLCGPTGASTIFGPQKGATASDVRALDALLARLATIADGCPSPSAVPATTLALAPGAGAAGGLGWALSWLGASLRPGAELAAEAINLDGLLADADLALTGEGSLDAQTLTGKAPSLVAQFAARHCTPTIALAGVVKDASSLTNTTFAAVHQITPDGTPRDQALANAASNLRAATSEAVGLWQAARLQGSL